MHRCQCVQDEDCRKFCLFDISIYGSKLVHEILQLIFLLNKSVLKNLRMQKEQFYDGWTHGSTHYVGVIASYLKRHKKFVEGVQQIVLAGQLFLLVMSPMGPARTYEK